ncbi:carbohydrate ABC transporter permease [Fodinicola acaciae]|uniref:carbohydrate ABC transporter permease n=1 Tax=Fodinicola acaciae TaxID=2681555 RepID=UPI0013D6C64F|nr:carbohydrate ABC transporter permease [Fodinicola acaciae]
MAIVLSRSKPAPHRAAAADSYRIRDVMPRWAWWVVCSLVAALFLFPLAMLVLTVLKSPAEANASPPAYLPHGISWGNFGRLGAAGSGVLHYIGNTALVSAGTTVGTVIVSTLAGYGFARFRFPGRSALFAVILATLMVPFQALLTPLYMVMQFLHLQNSLLGLTLVYVTFQLPLSVFLMRNSFAQIPTELEDAAAIDGCGSFAALRRVMLAVVRPGLVTVALFAFFASWNEFLAALVLLSDDSRYTLPVFLTTLVTGKLGAIEWGVLEAGVLVTMVPCVVIFLLLQRYYVKGLIAGAVH